MDEIILFPRDYFPEEIIIFIFDDLDLRDLLNLSSTNTWLMNFIRAIKWENIYVRIKKNISYINHVINTFKFINYDLSSSQITDESVKLLHGCHTLDLTGCKKITDDSVKLLHGCHTLDIRYYNKITDSSVKLLHGCHRLYLTGCDNITDSSVKLLRECGVRVYQ